MKTIILASALAATASLNAQNFVAGWDFDDVNLNATSTTANWGAQAGSATASWSHGLADFVTVFSNEFGISPSNNSAAINDSFTFLGTGIDATTGFDQFSDGPGANPAEGGFQSFTGDDTFTLAFDGSGYTDLLLTYAFAPSQGGTFEAVAVSLGSFNGVEAASYQFTPTTSGVYDNFAITGTAVPEPSSYAAILGLITLGVVAQRRRK
ncbi:MAG: PEP-CTERM sorting domain-containing protein [Opitutaceae bacterium]